MRVIPFTIVLACMAVAGCGRSGVHLADCVDTRIGVIDRRASNCVIGPQLPYGSINPSPQTHKGGTDSYNPEYPIDGFGQLHVSGTGWSTYGHFLVSPQTGLDVSTSGHGSVHSGDVTRPYYYRTELDRYGIGVEIAPSHYSAIYRLTYPASDSSSVVFDASQSIAADIMPEMHGKVLESSASIDPESRTISMSIRFSGGWPGGPYWLYLAGEYDTPAVETGVWKGDRVIPGGTEISFPGDGEHLGAYCRFSTAEGQQVKLKVAISFTGIEKARELLENEIPHWNFDKVVKQGRDMWDAKLGSIEVEPVSEEDRTVFCSAFYRALTLARDRSEDNSKWESDLPFWDDNYAFWDTFRTAYPLLTLVDEPAMRDNLLALIDRYRHNGCVYDGFVAGIDRPGEQGGNDVDHVIVDAYLKGVRGVAWDAAYEIVRHNAMERRIGHHKKNETEGCFSRYKELGWIPECVMSSSQTLEFAYNDYSAALMAKGLGHEDDCRLLMERSRKWVNLWNPDLESHGYRGFIDARKEDGSFSFIDPVRYGGSWSSPFYEASSWTYSYYVPHDMDRLIELMGGAEKFAERLEYGFRKRLTQYVNEPGFLTPRAFVHAGRVDLSSYWVHQIMEKGFDLKGYPGNDDTGSMGSWFVFSSIGFFPNAGQDYYYLNAPLFTRSRIRLPDGHILTITSNASEDNVYIASCKIDGREWNSPFILHRDLVSAHTIEFTLSDVPTEWGGGHRQPEL